MTPAFSSTAGVARQSGDINAEQQDTNGDSGNQLADHRRLRSCQRELLELPRAISGRKPSGPDGRSTCCRQCAARPHARPDRLHHRQRRLRALLVLRDAQHPHAVPRLLGAAVRRDGSWCPRRSARGRPRRSSTPSCWASTSSRSSAAGSRTGSWASTGPSSTSAWSTASARPAWPCS